MEHARKFAKTGHFVESNFLSENECMELNEEILRLADAPNALKYSDRNGNLRRMENFTYKSEIICSLNNRIKHFLASELGMEFELFKDKVNFKPQGGEGFYPHYDGIFEFIDHEGQLRKGWYEYADQFINVLVALDPFTKDNGAIEIAERRSGSFDELLKDTKRDGTPDLLPEVESECIFEPILVKPGDLCIFDHTCPHKSDANKSDYTRRSLYLTYNPSRYGNFYDKYFLHKDLSKNKNKSLTGKLA